MKKVILCFFAVFLVLQSTNVLVAGDLNLDQQNARLPNDTCALQGVVMRVEKWLNQKYENTPSIFNDVYVRVTLRVQASAQHDRYTTSSETLCHSFSADKDYHFRLCSPDRPEPGDIVTAIAAHPARSTEDGCLFDLKTVGSALKKKN